MHERPESSLPPASTTPVEVGLPASGTAAPPRARASHPRRRSWPWALALLILLAIGGVWLYRRHMAELAAQAAAHRPPTAVPVTVATARRSSIGVYLSEIGTVTPVYTDTITPEVTGIVNAVHYREGQVVQAGDPLVDIDPQPYQAQVEEAQGALKRDQALLAEDQMDLTRYQAAWAQNAIPRQQYEDQQKVVDEYQGVVLNDQGTLHYDQVELAFCHITSPIDGVAGLRLVDPGNVVTAGSTTPLVVVAQLEPITVIFTVSEDDLGEVLQQVRAGKRLTVQAWDRQQKTQLGTGTLASLDNQIDTTTGTLKLRADFPNRNRTLYPNQFVNVQLLVRTLQNQTLVPSPAVQHNGTAAYVFLIQGNHAVLRNVTTGESYNGETAVQGIQPGDVVANSSFDRLENGTPITISTMPLPSTSDTSQQP